MNMKNIARQRLETIQQELIDLSHRIHAMPELGFHEKKAATWLSEMLKKQKFIVQKGIHNLPTAFIANMGKGSLHIAICAEYDALPEIGHACGHNIIATAALGAAIAISNLTDDLDIKLSVIGTPSEESVGGKIILLKNGAFNDVHAAMMIHPAPFDIVDPVIIAASEFIVNFKGKESHASAFPELGINAADAMTIAQTAIGLLRQHIKNTDRIHGIITKGGDAPNVIPAFTRAKYIIRSKNLEELEVLRSKVKHCFEAGALATGCTLEFEEDGNIYANMIHHSEIAAIYQKNAEALGRTFPDLGDTKQRFSGSTDMGNISQVIPSIHPIISIDSLPAVNHQPEFTACCITPSADKAIIDGALAMAWTIIDIALDRKLRESLM